MVDAAEQDTPPLPSAEQLARLGTKWMERIHAAEKREDDWRKDAEAAERAYACDGKSRHGKLYNFNILYSNVETIVPAIYNSTPVPDVRCRYVEAIGDPPQAPQGQPGQPVPVDPRLQQAMAVYQQKAQYDADCKAYGDMIERAITVQIDDNRLDTEIESSAQDAFLAGRGVSRVRFEADVDGETVSNERITFETISWRDFRLGPAKRWPEVPWVAFRQQMARETIDRFADANLVSIQRGPDEKPPTMDADDDEFVVWEIWDKLKKQVLFIRETDSKVIKIEPDPLGLRGFFPMPAPVQSIALTGRMTPVCPFTIYRKLADELDLATKRINAIMKGLKVRGIIAGTAQQLIQLAEADDNEIVVATDLEQLVQTGGLDKAVMWWPVEQAIAVLSELYKNREVIKQAIYEITGISDIVRGASVASETATAQQIKTQWGSLRIQKMQRLIQRQVRDIFVISAEITSQHFSRETLQKMTGIPITPGIEQLMQQPVMASYRVDVESDSTISADLTRAKGEMVQFLDGTGKFFSVMGPLLAQAPQMAEPISEIYAAFARTFKLGRQAEDALERMAKDAKQAAGQRPPAPGQIEAEAKKAELQMTAQAKQAELAQKSQDSQDGHVIEWKKAVLSALTSIEVARIGAKTDMDSAQLEAQLEVFLGLAGHINDRFIARRQAGQPQQSAAA